MKTQTILPTIDREIGIFNCCFEMETIEPEHYVVVNRENGFVDLGLFILKDNQEDRTPCRIHQRTTPASQKRSCRELF